MVKNLDELIQNIESINEEFDEQVEEHSFIEKLDENGRNRFNNMHIAFKDIETRFTNALTYMVPESKINNNNISNAISWVKSGLKSADNYNNYIINSNFSKGFAILADLASAMPLPVAEASERLKDAARSLFSSIGQYQSRYQRNIEELETMRDQLINTTNNLEEKEHYINEKWNELENKINEKQQVLDHQYSQFQSDFLNNQTDRSTAFNSFIKELEDEKNNILEQIKDSFEAEKSDYLESLKVEKEKFLNEWENDFQTRDEELKNEHDNWKNDLESESDQLIKDLRKKQEEAASIVGNVANNGIAGHFANEAKNKAESVWWWRLFTIIAFAATIVVGFFLLIQQVGSDSGSMSVTELISRLVVTAALGSLTAYLAKLASNDEESRKYNSSMEIRLRTLNPYLDAFEDEEQIRLKKELFPVIFREDEKKKKESTDEKVDNKKV